MSTPAAAYVASGRPRALGNLLSRADPAVPGPLFRQIRGLGRENRAKQGSWPVSSFPATQRLSPVAGSVPPRKAVHIVKVANSVRARAAEPFLAKLRQTGGDTHDPAAASSMTIRASSTRDAICSLR